MSYRHRVRYTILLFGLPIAATLIGLGGLYFVTFVCGKIEDWPYFSPEMDGAQIQAASQPHIGGNGPRAVYPLGNSSSLSIQAFCYPRDKTGSQGCLIRVGIQQDGRADIKPVSMAISALAADGRELIDFEFYQEYASQIRLEIPGTILLKDGSPPDVFDMFLPNLQVDAAEVPIPRIRFTRVENKECVPLLINY